MVRESVESLQGFFLCPGCRWRNWGADRVSELPVVLLTQTPSRVLLATGPDSSHILLVPPQYLESRGHHALFPFTTSWSSPASVAVPPRDPEPRLEIACFPRRCGGHDSLKNRCLHFLCILPCVVTFRMEYVYVRFVFYVNVVTCKWLGAFFFKNVIFNGKIVQVPSNLPS